nr:FtsQ-type POTRA domain-containing protein [Corynebacterium mendelii]
MTVSDWQITGNQHTPAAEIRTATGITDGDNIARADLKSASAAVAGLPWIKQATVKRRLPSTIIVEVTERVPVMVVDRPDGPHLVDQDGVPFIIAEPGPGLVPVTGTPDGDGKVLAAVAGVIERVPEHLRPRIASIDAPDRFSITLATTDGKTIVWGSTDNAAAKAVALGIAVDQEGTVINISDPSQMAVRD